MPELAATVVLCVTCLLSAFGRRQVARLRPPCGSSTRWACPSTIGVVGLRAGPSPVSSGLQKSGASLILVGLIAAELPHTLAILFGRYVLRMNPLVLLGACTGAGTVNAALRALEENRRASCPCSATLSRAPSATSG